MSNIVKIDKRDAKPWPDAYSHLKMVGWPLHHNGTIVYVSRNKGSFLNYFVKHPTFKIFNDGVKPFIFVVGTYRGRSETFDPLNYMHQRHALLSGHGSMEEDSLKVGVRGHRVSMGNAINHAFTAAQWIADTGSKVSETIGQRPLKYFVAFTETIEITNVMHGQESATSSTYLHDSIAFAVVARKHGSKISGWLS